MKQILLDELKDLRMQILDCVDKFCRQNGIRYTISGGTLLGAVRHGGYIPWDDDVDIQMLRSDYVRFASLWKETADKHPYELVSIESGNNKGYPFAKISMPQTVALVDGVERTGVYIDLFPVDKVADLKDFRRRHGKALFYYRMQMLNFAWKRRKVARLSLAKMPFAWFCSLLSRNSLAVRINKIAQKKEMEDCPYCFEMVAGTINKEPIPFEVFRSYEDIPFENRKYMAVKDYHTYLKSTFGDYMKLPPEEKRVGHNSNMYYWK